MALLSCLLVIQIFRKIAELSVPVKTNRPQNVRLSTKVFFDTPGQKTARKGEARQGSVFTPEFAFYGMPRFVRRLSAGASNGVFEYALRDAFSGYRQQAEQGQEIADEPG